MADIENNETIDVVNSLIRDRVVSNISWHNAAYPANSIPSWFNATGYPGIGKIDYGNVGVEGDVDASNLNGMIAYFAGLHAHIRRVRIIIYYNNNGALQVLSDQNAVGIMATYQSYSHTLPQQVVEGTPAARADLVNLCNAQYNNWLANAGNPITQTLTNTVCHTNCHSNCHSNRGRR